MYKQTKKHPLCVTVLWASLILVFSKYQYVVYGEITIENAELDITFCQSNKKRKPAQREEEAHLEFTPEAAL